MKADKMYFIYLHSCGFSPPLSYFEFAPRSSMYVCVVCVMCVCRMHRYVSLSRLPLPDNILQYDDRSISMSIYTNVGGWQQKPKHAKTHKDLRHGQRKALFADTHLRTGGHNAL